VLWTHARVQAHRDAIAAAARPPSRWTYQVDGSRYAPDRGDNWDGFRDLQYAPRCYGALRDRQACSAMFAWNPWASDTGWYWMFYNKNAVGSAPVVGVFVGKASRLGVPRHGPFALHRTRQCQRPAGGYSQPSSGGLTFQTHRANPDGAFIEAACIGGILWAPKPTSRILPTCKISAAR
jgi:hypothetical protein